MKYPSSILVRFVVLILFTCELASGLNVLLYSAGFAKSWYLYYGRLIRTLQKHGHTVTTLQPVHSERMKKVLRYYPPCNSLEFQVKPSEVYGDEDVTSVLAPIAFNFSFIAMWSRVPLMMDVALRTDQSLLENEYVFYNATLEGKFDAILTYSLFLPPHVVAHYSRTPVIWLSPGNFLSELTMASFGIPYSSSFAPVLIGNYTDHMSFGQRMKNIPFGYMSDISRLLGFGLIDKEHAVFSKPPDIDLPSVDSLLEQSNFVAVNGEILLDFPRPISHGVLYSGELETRKEHKLTDLDGKFAEILAKPTIVFSLGTVASSKVIPQSIKENFLRAFQEMSEYNFIWKFDGQIDVGSANHVFVKSWIPQRQILIHPNVKLFITHGGYNSLLESVTSGVPMILVPLFADQEGNAKRAIRIGSGARLDRYASSEEITAAIRSVSADEGYQKRASKVQAMVEDSVIPRDELLVRHFQYNIKHHGHIPRIRGRTFPVFKLYSLDVIGFLVLLLYLLVILIFKAAIGLSRFRFMQLG